MHNLTRNEYNRKEIIIKATTVIKPWDLQVSFPIKSMASRNKNLNLYTNDLFHYSSHNDPKVFLIYAEHNRSKSQWSTLTIKKVHISNNTCLSDSNKKNMHIVQFTQGDNTKIKDTRWVKFSLICLPVNN